MRSDILRRIISTSISIILAIIFVMFIQIFLLRSAIVHTNEMAPTLNKNDYIMINKLKVTFNLLNEGDIIMYRHHNQIHFSRIIGKAGESIEIRHGKLYKDDRQVNKYYAKNRGINDFALRDLENTDGDIIPPDSFLVLNDHSNTLTDSRRYGLIKKSDVIGNVCLRYYPFRSFNYEFNK